jgi:hypothetical protein
MSWLAVAALGILWAAFLLPSTRRVGSLVESVEDFERNMDLLAETGRNGDGRWIITPRKGAAFLGPSARAEARARRRRRRVFVFFLESIGLTLLIGLVPPLRLMWSVGAVLIALLGVYIWLLLWLKQRTADARARVRVREASVPARARPVTERYVSDGRVARPAINGLDLFEADDLTGIVVRPARRAGVAGAAVR